MPDLWSGDPTTPHSQYPSYQYAGNNPITFVDPTGLKEWQPSSSRIERIIERVYEQGRPEIHLEFNRFGWRPDILNSVVGEVFEIKPLTSGGPVLAWIEAKVYAEALNSYKADTILGGPTGLLPHRDPNNWNLVDWHLGNPLSFPPLLIPGGTRIPTAYGVEFIWGPVDLVAVSVFPGTVTWFFVPKAEVAAALAACGLAEKYGSDFIKYVQSLRNLPPEGSTCCPTIIISPRWLIDPTSPWHPANPRNCWEHPEYCKNGGPKN